MNIELLSGSFISGCGILAYDRQAGDFYHLIVVEDIETGKAFVEIGNKRFYEEEIVIK